MKTRNLTDYYLMREIIIRKSHRFDCVASTGCYELFEEIGRKSRVKRFYCRYDKAPDTFSAHAKRKADMALLGPKKSISSVFILDKDYPLMGCGDIKDTDDALLFIFSEDGKQLEIFVARGGNNLRYTLWQYMIAGDLDEEMRILRDEAKPTNAPQSQG